MLKESMKLTLLFYRSRILFMIGLGLALLTLPTITHAASYSALVTDEIARVGGLGKSLTFILIPSLVFLLYVGWVAINNFVPRPLKARLDPPMALPPAIASVLLYGEVTPNALVATIFDLANRGYLVLIEKNGAITFGRENETTNELNTWEIELYRHLFPKGERKVTHAVHSWSPLKQSSSYKSLYDTCMQLGFFTINPRTTWLRYRVTETILLLVALTFLLIVFLAQLTVFLLPGLAMLLLWYTLILLKHRLVRRSANGKKILKEWLEFRNHLTKRSALDPKESVQNFITYLPYAIAMNAAEPWIYRSRDRVVVEPRGFVTYDKIDTSRFSEYYWNKLEGIRKAFAKLHGTIER